MHADDLAGFHEHSADRFGKRIQCDAPQHLIQAKQQPVGFEIIGEEPLAAENLDECRQPCRRPAGHAIDGLFDDRRIDRVQRGVIAVELRSLAFDQNRVDEQLGRDVSEKAGPVSVGRSQRVAEQTRDRAAGLVERGRLMEPAVIVEMGDDAGGQFGFGRLTTVGEWHHVLLANSHPPIRHRQPVGHGRSREKPRTIEKAHAVGEVVQPSTSAIGRPWSSNGFHAGTHHWHFARPALVSTTV